MPYILALEFLHFFHSDSVACLVESLGCFAFGPSISVESILHIQRKSNYANFLEMPGAYRSLWSTCQPPGKIRFDQNLSLIEQILSKSLEHSPKTMNFFRHNISVLVEIQVCSLLSGG